MSNKPYRAIAPIEVAPYVRAHNIGDIVPDENVESNGWQSLVAREGTKAADKAVTEAPSTES